MGQVDNELQDQRSQQARLWKATAVRKEIQWTSLRQKNQEKAEYAHLNKKPQCYKSGLIFSLFSAQHHISFYSTFHVSYLHLAEMVFPFL